jgi:hypothetical protein
VLNNGWLSPEKDVVREEQLGNQLLYGMTPNGR